MTPDPWCDAAKHGDRKAYRRGCRCTDARADAQRSRNERLAKPATIDATGTRRRIQALLRAGWPADALAPRLFVTRQQVLLWTRQARIWTVNADKVALLYDEIGCDWGPSDTARLRNAERGWPLPIEWGEDIDDPAAKPLKLDRVRTAVAFEDIAWLAQTGESWEAAQARLGMSRTAIEQRLFRARRHDLYAMFARNSQRVSEQRNQWSA